MDSKLLLLTLLFVALPLVSIAGPPVPRAKEPFTVSAKVYCDTCRCGFETKDTFYIADAWVKIECKAKSKDIITYTQDGKTDKDGQFTMVMDYDMGDDICDVVLVSSPLDYCNTPDPGRSHARIILTNYNGIQTASRCSNNLGFLKNQANPQCEALLKYYLQDIDDI